MPTPATKPDLILWLADPVLSRVRAGQVELKQGARDGAPGGAVSKAQNALGHWGRDVRRPAADLLPRFGPDGAFGAETRAAVVAFQRENRDKAGAALAPDGVLGDLTLGALDRVVAAPGPAPAPPPGPPDDGAIPLAVDVLAFRDGPEPSYLNGMFPAAREVFGRMHIRVEPGAVRDGWRAADAPALAAVARRVFECNQPGRPGAGGAAARVTADTAFGDTRTGEVRRLQAHTHPRRITVCLVDQFPMAVGGKGGVTLTRETFGVAPTVFVAKCADAVEVFWHELCHALLDTPLGAKDHEAGTITAERPDPSTRRARITDAQRQRMRATARTLC